MELKEKIQQKQVQGLSLTQGMRQSILILQSDAIDLADYLSEQSLENPLFDVHVNLDMPFIDNEDSKTYQIKDEQQSLFEYLLDQVQLTMRKTPLRDLVVYLIEQLDPNGYLTVSDEEIFAEEKDITPIMLLDAKTLLHQLDPPGIGARDLRECLYLQAEADHANKAIMSMLSDKFELFTKHEWKQLKRSLKLSNAELQEAVNFIQSLSANPGQRYTSQNEQYVVPELQIRKNNHKLTLSVTKYGQPQLIFAQETYDRLAESTDEDVKKYIHSKYNQYKTLEYNLQRRIDTISIIGKCIVKAQYKFFMQETDALAPLLIRDVAQKLQMSESTVSRTINGKYIQTDFGVFELKEFFSRRSKVTVGEEQSVDQVKAKIRGILNNEDKRKPLSDQVISEMLVADGLQIARRTVAKYREELGFPATSRRRI
ncbi:Sigma 54 transcription factor [Companilactobacillus mindensis DSM 14500]|uniref:Sigma 54 transcription factor n=1 Tax=Companilactobacillus mindensis DSM 14500 TaxID=1423770 RepID=A0A0R1QNY6_9LACO|nr:RNA polymerase factor sigma-54 [Companilactobacillus mindensis]KRL44404.1 Sigma 54 transcription factor [Companilactobacillus mindensis DSM 14500]GEO79733.1 RNA polymerase sigma-54 factor [Companilactobacillus mindensis]